MEIIINIIGLPLSGKTTLCEKLVRKYDFVHIALGKLIRENEMYKKVINHYISKGELIPSDITFKILQKDIEKHKGTNKVILIDGYPRNYQNLNKWEIEYGLDPKCVILLKCPEKLLNERLNIRMKKEKRKDDRKDLLNLRIKSFEQETSQVIDHYRKKGILYEISSAENENMMKEIDAILEEMKLI